MTESVRQDPALAVVVIGRNEGERLAICLHSVRAVCDVVVYVDSGSTDGSVALASGFGVEVVELDPGQPFTAARARNEGIRFLCARPNPPALVQVIDGDCGLVSTWLQLAAAFLAEHEEVGLVCGRRRERRPEVSIYNRLCDLEWNTPVGPADGCGGDVLMRISAFEQAGGYNPTMIAGEDPEFAYRVRRAGWAIHRLPQEMTLHDADITSFKQWWIRATRAGHAYAECFDMHRGDGAGFARRELLSIVFWGLCVPLGIVLALALFGPWMALALGVYLVLGLRVRGHRLRRGDPTGVATAYAAFCVLGKFAEARGVLRYVLRRVRGGEGNLIEYKSSTRPTREPEA